MTRLQRTLRSYLSERSQAMTEFAIIAPVLFLVLFGIIDFGRVIYYYVSLQQAVNEGARVAVNAPTPPADVSPTQDTDVLAAMRRVTPSITMNLGPCPNGPIDTTQPPGGQANVYITQPNGVTAPPAANAPAGQPIFPGPPAGCNALQRAGFNGQNNAPLQVEIRYDFQPITPLISQVVGNNIVITAYAAYRTEY